jgi:hypothetical protein
VAPIRLTITARLTNGVPRQFTAIWEKSRCSIRFHLLVPGGRWQTVTESRVRLANAGAPISTAGFETPCCLPRPQRSLVQETSRLGDVASTRRSEKSDCPNRSSTFVGHTLRRRRRRVAILTPGAEG